MASDNANDREWGAGSPPPPPKPQVPPRDIGWGGMASRGKSHGLQAHIPAGAAHKQDADMTKSGIQDELLDRAADEIEALSAAVRRQSEAVRDLSSMARAEKELRMAAEESLGEC